MRLRASAFQRRSRQRGDPAGVQGEAAVPVHAPLVPEDRLLSAQRGDARPRGLPAAEGSLTPSWPGLSRPSTSLPFDAEDVDGPHKAREDEKSIPRGTKRE